MKTIRIVGMPFDDGAPQRGAQCGPAAIRIAGLEEKLKEQGLEVEDEGDCYVKDGERLTRPLWLAVRRFPIVLGGDHSIAVDSIYSISTWTRRVQVGVIWMDAHADMNTPDTSPTGNLHGMALAKCIESTILSTGAKATPIVKPENVVIVGVRDFDKLERERLSLLINRVKVFTMEDIDRQGIYNVMDKAIRSLARCNHIHLSFDIDVVDPEIAPGTGTPVKGGLTYREAHLAMEVLARSERLGSMDMVEVNPLLDNKNQTAELAVELIQSVLGKRIFE